MLGGLSAQAQDFFIPNKGQWSGDFQYTASFGGTSFFLDDDHLAFTLVEEESEPAEGHIHTLPIRGHHFRVHFVGANSSEIIPEQQSSHTYNYYHGPRSTWRSGLHGAEVLLIPNLYDGVDLKVYTRYGQLKYDLLSNSAKSLRKVTFYYEGADDVKVYDGRIHVSTSVGEVVEGKPYAYNPETRKAVDVAFHLENDTLRFDIDPSYEGPLVIDPDYIFSTYSGSSRDHWGYSATYHPIDSTVYAAGIATGAGVYPTTPGALDSIPGGGNDVALMRLSSDGKTLIYSALIGGEGSEQPSSIIADDLGRLYIVGTTGSLSFPVTTTAYDTTFNFGTSQNVNSFSYGAGSDLFISVISPDGTKLIGSTYLGGLGNDGLNVLLNNIGDPIRGEIILSPTGTIMVANVTRSTDIPLVNAFQTTNAGNQDVWMFEMDSTCENLLWSTYFGGPVNDAGFALRTNSTGGKVYVCGVTDNSTLAGSANGANPTSLGGRDGFVTMFSGAGRIASATTYNGTTAADYNFLIDVDDEGDVYVYGQTDGVYPTTPGAISEPNGSVFVQQFDSTLAVSKRSLCFGNGKPNSTAIAPTAFAVDDCGDVYLSGWGGGINSISSSTTSGMYVTSDAYQSTTDGSDFYFAVIDASFRKFNYATFFGANDNTALEHVDGGTSRFDPHGVMYQAICAGCGGRSTLPTFPSDVHSRVNASHNCNLALTVIAFNQQSASVSLSVPDTVCSPFQLVLSDTITAADYVIWNFGNGDVDTSFTVPNRLYSTPGTYTIQVIAVDTNCHTTDTALVEFEVVDPQVSSSFTMNYDKCDLNRVVSFVPSSNNATYYWSFGDGDSAVTNGNTNHTYTSAGPFTIQLIAVATNCFGAKADTSYQTVQFVSPPADPRIEFRYDGCSGQGVGKFYAIGNQFGLYEWTLSDGQTATGNYFETTVSEGFLTVTLKATDTVCNQTYTVIETFQVVELAASFAGAVPNVFSPDGDGLNDVFKLRPGVNASSINAFRIKVYDRWGQPLFESSDPDFEWNGRYHSRQLTEGVYFWIIETSSYCGSGIEEKGTVTILYKND